jgi:hypothetical protein
MPPWLVRASAVLFGVNALPALSRARDAHTPSGLWLNLALAAGMLTTSAFHASVWREMKGNGRKASKRTA